MLPISASSLCLVGFLTHDFPILGSQNVFHVLPTPPERHKGANCAAKPDPEEDDDSEADEEFGGEVVTGSVECEWDQLLVLFVSHSILTPSLKRIDLWS